MALQKDPERVRAMAAPALPTLHPPAPFWLQVSQWAQFPALVHGFSGRLPNQAVTLAEPHKGNWTLCTLKQVHGNEIVIIDRHHSPGMQPEADGMITAEPGFLLAIATADCVPVLMVEPEKGVLAALHAGWRGTLKGISVRAVETFVTSWRVDPQRLWVALGPAIGGCCYEVGREVGEALCQRWGMSNPATWRPVGEKGFLDLRMLNLDQLEHVGVPRAQIYTVGPCTFCDSFAFASYRREGVGTGRQFGVIGWQHRRTERV